MSKKTCSKCGVSKLLQGFPTRKTSPDGRRAQCNECTNGKRRTYDAKRVSERSIAQPSQTPAATAREAQAKLQSFVNDKWPSVSAFERESARELDTSGFDLTDVPVRQPKIEVIEEVITRIEEHRLKRQVKDLKSEKEQLTSQLSDGGQFAEIIDEVLARQAECIPTIQPRERKSGLLEATPMVAASDWHIEHEVRPEQVAGRNRYNLEISKRRMERFFEATRWAIKHQREVFKIRDLIFWIGGDIIQNYLHEDDNESNLLSPTEAILYAQAEITRGIEFLLEDPELEQIIIPTNDGNHGRTTKKMRSSTRIENSYEVFLYAQLALRFKNEPRIKIILPTSQFTFLDDIYGHTIRFLHGDVFKYGGGVGGITVPMLRAQARWETVKHASLTVMGHWHQRICLPNLMVNGSLIGYDPYAMGGGFPFEPPVQSMRMLDSKRFCSTDIPLWVSDREDDDMNVGA